MITVADTFPGTHLDIDELYILSGLLYKPEPDANETIADLAKSWDWLEPASRDLSCAQQALWQAEYVRLLGGQNPLCSPCESNWSDRVLTGSLDNLGYRYHSAGIQVYGCPRDHLALQLVYAAWYLEEEATYDSEHWIEIWTHLSYWVPLFANCLARHTRLRLYQVFAKRLLELFTVEQQEF